METRLVFWVLVILVSFPCSSALVNNKTQSPSKGGSSFVFQLVGNVYPLGIFYAALDIGNPSKPYFLDIDTGSDLTWVNCDAPCVKCLQAPHPPHQPKKDSFVTCADPICAAVNDKCPKPNEKCHYVVNYGDDSSSEGVLIKDVLSLSTTNVSQLRLSVVFGCGYDQKVPGPPEPSPIDGVLGLGKGKSSIVSQIHNFGLIKNVIGHCFSGQGGGFVFIGDQIVPSSGVVWAPMSNGPSDKHYSPGSSELFFGNQSTGVKDLLITIDSGSTYTYFNSKAYQAFCSSLEKDLVKTPLRKAEDGTLPLCWKGPFKSVQDIKKYFKPVTLFFSNANARMEITPEAYLIISEKGNACLGILNGTEIGLEDCNIIGDISLQDRLVIYDNENGKIGWASKDCQLPKPGSVS